MADRGPDPVVAGSGDVHVWCVCTSCDVILGTRSSHLCLSEGTIDIPSLRRSDKRDWNRTWNWNEFGDGGRQILR
jgi:hypothetical protein